MRYLCDVLVEMREAHKTHNYSYLPGLIEEAQSLGNRMEAGLNEKNDYYSWHKKAKAEKAELERLREKANKLRTEVKEPLKGNVNKYE